MRIRVTTASLAAAGLVALAAGAPSWGASNSANRNPSNNGVACAKTQSANSPSLNSRAATCTSGPTGLTVKFVGEANTTDGTTFAYRNWVDFFGGTTTPLTASFCESGSTTNCVTFPVGATAGSTQTLTLSGPSKALDIAARHLCEIDLWTSAPTAATADVGTPNPNATEAFREDYLPLIVTGTTTTTWSNGDTLYWTDNTYCE